MAGELNGDLDRRELVLAEATLGEGAVTKVRAVGAPGKPRARVELRKVASFYISAKLHKKQLPGGAPFVKPALDKKASRPS